MLFEPLYIYSARALGNQLHAIPAVVNLPVTGQAFLFDGLLPGASSGFVTNPIADLAAVGNDQVAYNRKVVAETQYISFLQPFYELIAYAVINIKPNAYNFAANAPPFGIPAAANVNQANTEIHLPGNCKMRWKYMIPKHSTSYYLLPFFRKLGLYEAANRPQPAGPSGAPVRRELKHFKMCPTRKDDGLQFHSFDLDTINQLFWNLLPAALAANGGVPMMYNDPLPAGGPRPIPNRCPVMTPAQCTSLLFQFFNHSKLRQLNYNPATDVYTFANRGLNMQIGQPRIITDGEQVYLSFLVTHPNTANGRRRIPTEMELQNRSAFNNPGFHDEFKVARNPDIYGGAMLLLKRRPIMTPARAIQLPTGGDRPIIGVDFGQRNHICAVYGDRLDVAATQQALFVPGVPQPAPVPIRTAMQEPVKIVHGCHYREKNGTAWFERKHKAFIAQAVASHTALNNQFALGLAPVGTLPPPQFNLQEMIDNLPERQDALYGGTVRSISDYYNIFYQQMKCECISMAVSIREHAFLETCNNNMHYLQLQDTFLIPSEQTSTMFPNWTECSLAYYCDFHQMLALQLSTTVEAAAVWYTCHRTIHLLLKLEDQAKLWHHGQYFLLALNLFNSRLPKLQIRSAQAM
ncbi:hypothetical protein HDU86_000596 [Geranomyces michiganensis]|nr:hypothetical protein HDU86_000596 [Geranomyces michiganensis]